MVKTFLMSLIVFRNHLINSNIFLGHRNSITNIIFP
uniref:Uncharacterized protein n=1 Tax=Anguilla anguilla TaxID=7936 RepID=A0A0E9R7M2_ANGAN